MPQDFHEIKQLLHENRSTIWIFTGDSITHGAQHTNGFRSYVEHFQERLRWELRQFHDVVINTGISGHTASDLLETFDERITRFSPAVVFVMIGMNDCTRGQSGCLLFKNNLAQIIHRIREIGAIPVLQTPNPIDIKNDRTRAELAGYVEIIREEALAKNLVLIDHYAYWQSQKPNQGDVRGDWLNDTIHPNQYGHMEMTRKIFTDLGIFYSESPTCQLGLPHQKV
ncbi:SGNH/GDSL hydrolase family protein [Paenibacillus sp. LHD-38]|uniref:SGNH/GDSL hydrolase family protein n=1 Tax=Paenibacillus sp. LHD-38 TaxID=3072143 RepID=UPI00280D403B|nr:SGNH/GDSL hydrolase family protein [Paenibacillus sp. LHD-38]MDQ8734508.1 SGNH/GDSL hydrolase family protein [Paenibacillus sp. LHD-38]